MKDKTIDPQIREFIEQIDQLNRFHQEAVVFIAAKSILQKQDEQDVTVVTVKPSKTGFPHWAGSIFQYLKRQIQRRNSGKRVAGERSQARVVKLPNRIVIDGSPLPWPLDQPSWTEDDIELPPQIIHPNDEKKGDPPYE